MLRQILESLAWYILLDEDAWFWSIEHGITADDWPDCDPKRLVLDFRQMHKNKSFSFCRHHFRNQISKLNGDYIPPTAPAILELYRDKLNQYRTGELTKALIKNPHHATTAINKYLSDTMDTNTFSCVGDDILAEAKANEDDFKAGKNIVRVPQWNYLSEAIGGFNPGRVGMLAAETGFGKTAFGISLALSASNGMRVLCVNMEMSGRDFLSRFITAGAGISYQEWKECSYNPDKLTRIWNEFEPKNMFYTKGKALTIDQIMVIAKRSECQLMILDYDQKIEVHTDYRTPEWKTLQIAMESLEELSKSLGIYVLVLAQADENGNPSGSKRSRYPCSSVMRFYREPNDNQVYVYLNKNRFGKNKTAIRCKYDPKYSLVKEEAVFHDFNQSSSWGKTSYGNR